MVPCSALEAQDNAKAAADFITEMQGEAGPLLDNYLSFLKASAIGNLHLKTPRESYWDLYVGAPYKPTCKPCMH